MRGLSYVGLALLLCVDAQVSAAQGYVRSQTGGGALVAWSTSCVPLYLNAQGRSRLTVTEIEEVVRRSSLAWSDPSCAQMSLVYEGQTTQLELGYDPDLAEQNKNIIIFRSGQSGDTWPHDPNALALTTVTFCDNDSPACPAGTVVDADVEFNEVLYYFSTGDRGPLNDLENTLTHELGHLLGFEHSASPSSTMYAVAPTGERSKRDLDSVDISGLCAAYPAASCLACDLSSYDLTAESSARQEEACVSASGGGGGSGCSQGQGEGPRTLWALVMILGLWSLKWSLYRPRSLSLEPNKHKSERGRQMSVAARVKRER